MTSPRFSFRYDPKRRVVIGQLAGDASALAVGHAPRRFGSAKDEPLDNPPALLRVALARKTEGRAGLALAKMVSIEWLAADCRDAVRELTGKDFAYVVYSAVVQDARLRQRGYGALLYATMLVLAAEQGAAIVADECAQGITSAAAAKVWTGRALAEIAHVRGYVAASKAIAQSALIRGG